MMPIMTNGGQNLKASSSHSTTALWMPMEIGSPHRGSTGGRDNFDHFIENGFLETNNLTIASSFDKGTLRFSTSHTYQKGINPNTHLNIFNYNLSGSYKFDEKTEVNGYANFNFQTSPNNPNVDYGPNSYIYNMLIWGGDDWDVRALRDYWQEGERRYSTDQF